MCTVSPDRAEIAHYTSDPCADFTSRVCSIPVDASGRSGGIAARSIPELCFYLRRRRRLRGTSGACPAGVARPTASAMPTSRRSASAREGASGWRHRKSSNRTRNSRSTRTSRISCPNISMIDPLGALAAWDLPLYNESRHQIAKGEKRAPFGEPRPSLNRASDARFGLRVRASPAAALLLRSRKQTSAESAIMT